MEILETIYEFKNKDFNTTIGLYHVELDSGNKYYFLRNNNSVGTISHRLGEPATSCISIIREDVRTEFFKLLEQAEKTP